MIDREILATRLSKLRESLRKLKTIADKSREDYLASETDQALAEHFLRLALESMLDTGNHLVAARGLRKPLHLREIPLILAQNGVIPPSLGESLARATGLRNRLVHRYTEIDHGILFGVIQESLADLERFAAAAAAAVDVDEEVKEG